MATGNPVKQPHAARPPALAAALFCLLFCLGLGAQELPLWQLEEGGEGSRVSLDAARLGALQPGESFELELPGGVRWSARIEDVRRFPNGDLGLQALLEDTSQHSLVMTLGAASAHGSLSSPEGVYQFRARLEEGVYAGPLRRYDPVRAQSPADDFVSPPGPAVPGETGGAFSVRQQTASAGPLPEGGELIISLDVTNQSGLAQHEVFADVFFLLENTSLVAAPAACAEILSSDDAPVLSCRLGSMAAGESRSFSWTVATGAASHPLVYSTVLVGDPAQERDSRDDLIVEVFRDVLGDSDGDGLSDYNEGLLGSDPADGLSPSEQEATVIDILPVFAGGVDEFYEGAAQTRFNQLLGMANVIYEESGVAIRLRQAGALWTGYLPSASLEEDLRALTYASDPAFEPVARARVIHGADLVVLLRTMGESAGLCGLANLGAQGLEGDFSAPYQKEYAYSVINLDCLDDSVLAHELGHNMGLVHSRLEDPAGGTFAWAAGFGQPAQALSNFPGFVTVMAYSGDYGTDNKVFRFSNPRVYCGPSTAFVCGRDPAEDPDFGADAAAALNFVRHQIAAYLPSVEERLSDLHAVEAQPKGESAARILAGASADAGYSYGQSFAAGDAVDVSILLHPDPAHLGEDATLHAVFKLGDKGFFQFDQEGRLVPWENMDLTRLEPYGPVVTLEESMRFDPLEDFSVLEHGLPGQRVAVFAAYRVVSTGKLVYSSRPLSFVFDVETPAEALAETL